MCIYYINVTGFVTRDVNVIRGVNVIKGAFDFQGYITHIVLDLQV